MPVDLIELLFNVNFSDSDYCIQYGRDMAENVLALKKKTNLNIYGVSEPEHLQPTLKWLKTRRGVRENEDGTNINN